MDTTSREEIAANVRAAMARKRLDQTSLAATLGISRSALSDRCRGITNFRVDELQLVAAALEVPLSDLIEPRSPEVSVG